MAKKIIYSCDRCTKPIEGQPETKVEVYHFGFYRMDLCDDCAEELRKFMEDFGVDMDNHKVNADTMLCGGISR